MYKRRHLHSVHERNCFLLYAVFYNNLYEIFKINLLFKHIGFGMHWLNDFLRDSFDSSWLHCLVCPSQFNFSDYNVDNWRSDPDKDAKEPLNLLVTDFLEKLQKNRTHLCYFSPTSKRLTGLEQYITFTLETLGPLSTSESYNAWRMPRVCMAWHDP